MNRLNKTEIWYSYVHLCSLAPSNSAAAKKKKKKKKKILFSSGSNRRSRHKLICIKLFVLTSSVKKPMLTSWQFGACGDIFGQKHAFLTEKNQKLELHCRTVESHQWVVISRGSHPNMS